MKRYSRAIQFLVSPQNEPQLRYFINMVEHNFNNAFTMDKSRDTQQQDVEQEDEGD